MCVKVVRMRAWNRRSKIHSEKQWILKHTNIPGVFPERRGLSGGVGGGGVSVGVQRQDFCSHILLDKRQRSETIAILS
jgi:hypothetical protein